MRSLMVFSGFVERVPVRLYFTVPDTGDLVEEPSTYALWFDDVEYKGPADKLAISFFSDLERGVALAFRLPDGRRYVAGTPMYTTPDALRHALDGLPV